MNKSRKLDSLTLQLKTVMEDLFFCLLMQDQWGFLDKITVAKIFLGGR